MSSTPSEAPSRPHRIRFVTLCQQLLALAVVVAVLTPAARTVSMDVRPSQPSGGIGADLQTADMAVEVPTEKVEAEVNEYALTSDTATGGKKILRATEKEAADGGQSITSDVLPVTGYGTVGVTWAPGTELDHDAIGVQVRTQTNGEWSEWTEAEYHDEHGPDPETDEGKRARPGTEALLIGEVDAVQVKVDTTDAAPADMKLAVIDPGETDATAKQGPAIDTGTAATTDGATDATEDTPAPTDDATGSDDALALQAGVVTPKPQIYSRAQWGADESIRDKGSLSYYEVHGGFVHHTVNGNDYTGPQVAGIIRSIYSYHVKTRGWSDIGYNFLIDKFGRIWEGRAGGVDRAVVGAHTSGYNQYAFAASAIGNFETTQPRPVMLESFAKLFAWKLSLHGVRANSTNQTLGSKRFQAINGHRDAGSTACPGRYLYAKIPEIRKRAAQLQAGWSGRELNSNLVGVRQPDIIARRTSDGQGMVLPIRQVGTSYVFSNPINTGQNFSGLRKIWNAGDWDRDGKVDVLGLRESDGAVLLYRGTGGGKLANPIVILADAGKIRVLSPVGDMTGDGYPDLIGAPGAGAVRIYPGRGATTVGASYPAYSAIGAGVQIGAGRWNANDGAPDSIVRQGQKMTVYYGNGPGGWTSAKVMPQPAKGWDWFLGVSSVDGDGHTDLLVRTRTTHNVYFFRGTAAGIREAVLVGNQSGYDIAG